MVAAFQYEGEKMLKKLGEIATVLDELGHTDLADQIDEVMTVIAAKKKKTDSKAAVRNRGKVVFDAKHPKVKDNKDHFPINSAAQARNALARANQFSKAPSWFKGTVQELVNAVAKAVKKHYPSIDVSKKATKPGKG